MKNQNDKTTSISHITVQPDPGSFCGPQQVNDPIFVIPSQNTALIAPNPGKLLIFAGNNYRS
jgi:hypothetical protein